MAAIARDPSFNGRISAQGGDSAELASPFPRLDLELSRDELRETAYEIFAASCKTASVGTFGKNKTGLSYVSQASQKSLTSTAASKIKKALGLRSKKTLENDQINASSKSKKPVSVVDIVRLQMGISDQTDTRTRRALSRTAAGQVGKHVESILLPLELLQQIRLADFADPREFYSWQKRQLKVLEAGLLLHPAVTLEQSNIVAQQLKQLLRGTTEKPLETGKNSESMQALRSAATNLAGRTDSKTLSEACHWADGFPLNLHLYQTLLSSCFDRTEETAVIDEIDEAMDLIKKTWGILGINQALHNVCFMWVLFRQFVISGQSDFDLLGAAETQMVEVANDAKSTKDSLYVLVLSSILSAIQAWGEKRLLAYHDTFPAGAKGLMENVLPVTLNAAKILHDDISHEFRRKRKDDVDVASSRIDVYVRSSMRTAFAQMMEQADAKRKSTRRDQGPLPTLVVLAKDATNLIAKEREIFSPVLKRWHPFAAGLAAATLHSCFRRELNQFLSGVNILTPEAVEVLQSADQLEKELVQIAVEDAVESEDGGKGVIREMTPFEAEAAIANLSKNWIQERLDRLREWVERNVQQEQWNPQAIREHYAPSAVEVLRMIEETLDAFFALPVTEDSGLLQDLVLGIDRALQRYVSQAKAGLGSKSEFLPSFPPLTRCKDSRLHGNLGGLWKKKDKASVVNRSKGQLGTANGAHKKGGSVSSGLPQICVRINTLYHIQTEVEVVEKRLSNSWKSDEVSSKSRKNAKSTVSESNGVHVEFGLTRTSLQEGIQQLSEIAVYRAVFQDLRSVFWEGLYSRGVAQARINHVLGQLDTQLEIIANTVNDRLRNRVASALMKACFEGLLMVLLAGGSSRAFTVNDAEMLDEDFAALKDLFKADGEGLPSEAVEKAAMPVSQILPLFSMETVDLIESFRSAISEAYGPASSKSKLPLPDTTGKWRPTDANTILRILCYRCDSTASKFLKKTYNLPKRN